MNKNEQTEVSIDMSPSSQPTYLQLNRVKEKTTKPATNSNNLQLGGSSDYLIHLSYTQNTARSCSRMNWLDLQNRGG